MTSNGSLDGSTPRLRADVCIVGAGIAGLNALFVASQYLTREQNVVLVDRRHRSGGMWLDTYDYVRLHQPHPLFTAGNIKWDLNEKPRHLATKGEVLDHFEHCLRIIRQRVRLDVRYGWESEGHEETDGMVRMTCRDSEGQTHIVESDKLIKAFGFGITPNEPLDLSSDRVRSVSPDYCDVRTGVGDRRRKDRNGHRPLLDHVIPGSRGQPRRWLRNCLRQQGPRLPHGRASVVARRVHECRLLGVSAALRRHE